MWVLAVPTTKAPGTVHIVLGLASSEWQSQDLNPGLPDLEPLISPTAPPPWPLMSGIQRSGQPTLLLAPSTLGGHAQLGAGKGQGLKVTTKGASL